MLALPGPLAAHSSQQPSLTFSAALGLLQLLASSTVLFVHLSPRHWDLYQVW